MSRVRRGRYPQLDAILGEIGSQRLGTHPDLPFAHLDMLHFASFTIFHDDDVGHDLVFECAFDGHEDEFLDALVSTGNRGLNRIYEHCTGFVAGSGQHLTKRFLKNAIHKPSLFHIGNPGRKLVHILAEKHLRETIDDVLDRHRGDTTTAAGFLGIVRDEVKAPRSPTTKDLFPTGAGPNFGWRPDPAQENYPLMVWQLLLVLLGAVGFGIACVLSLIPPVRRLIESKLGQSLTVFPEHDLGTTAIEKAVARGKLVASIFGLLVAMACGYLFPAKPKSEHNRVVIQPKKIRALLEQEDQVGYVQNHLASIVRLREGRFGLLRLRATFGLLNQVYRAFFTRGALAGVPGIHFAHWTILGDGRLLFLSNYDGSWDNYLDDFYERMREGIGVLWGRAKTFPGVPPEGGAAFKSWARMQQTSERVWYSAYPDLTVDSIDNNTRIRRGLFLAPGEEQSWLRRFGRAEAEESPVRKARHLRTKAALGELPTIELNDIQGVLLSGYDHLPHALYVLLNVNDPGATRTWLRDLLASRTITPATSRQDKFSVNVAFTYQGLRALGLDRFPDGTFQSSFEEGMVSPHRSRVLGDVDLGARLRALGHPDAESSDAAPGNEPENWRWGGPTTKQIHLILMLFAADAVGLKELYQKWVAPGRDRGAFGKIEDFEIVYGTMTENKREHFGFRDGISQPLLAYKTDQPKKLQQRQDSYAEDIIRPGEFILGYVDESGKIAAGPRDSNGTDFGRNGSYLVVRQLSQDVAAFDKCVDDQTKQPHGLDRESIAARFIGRWRDGRPLVQGGKHDNDFNFDESSDREGFTCPIGAHIRRANPRDGRTNRHRILRRGRSYKTQDECGLLFMCLNADIERQFEFIQQRWVNQPAFGGLYKETDPLIGHQPFPKSRATFQNVLLRQRVCDVPQFVSVKGGAYFFLPGIEALKYLANLEVAATDAYTDHVSLNRHRPDGDGGDRAESSDHG